MSEPTYIIVNLQNGSVTRPGGDREFTIAYAEREYGAVVSVNDSQRVVYVSQVPALL